MAPPAHIAPLFPSFAAAEGAEAADGGRLRVLRPRRAAPADAVRPTRAEVNLAHLRHNLRVLEHAMLARMVPLSAQPERSPAATLARPARVWGVLKADGYGHGAPAVARTLERAGIAGLCVALLEEGVELREAGIGLPILVLGGHYGARLDGLEELVARRLTPVVHDAETIDRLGGLLRAEGERDFSIHLKIDTGMGRLGVRLTELDQALDALARFPELRLDGLMTHLACADADDEEPTHEQMRFFEQATVRVRAAGHAPRLRHAANSAAALRFPETRLDMIRPGIAIFGVAPAAGLAPELRPAMRVSTEIVAVRQIPRGEAVGYGHSWRAARDSTVATIAMGYADGLSRRLSNRGHVLVRGRRAPIVGAISMDLTTVDVTDVPGAGVGAEAVVLGGQEGPLGRDRIDAGEIAEQTESIPWDVLTSVSRRVPRFYREP